MLSLDYPYILLLIIHTCCYWLSIHVVTDYPHYPP